MAHANSTDRLEFLIKEVAQIRELYHATQKTMRRASKYPFYNDLGQERSIEERHRNLEKMFDMIAKHCVPSFTSISAEQKAVYDYFFTEIAKQILQFRDFWLFKKALSFYDQVTPRYRAYQLATNTYMAYIGTSMQLTLQFCDAYFPAVQKTICCGEQLPESEKIEWTRNHLTPLLFICFATAISLSGEKFPQKQWLLNLLRGYKKGDDRVDDAVRKFSYALCIMNANVRIVKESVILDHLKKDGKSLSDFRPPSFDVFNPLLVIPDDCEQSFIDALEDRKKEVAEIESEAILFRSWYLSERHLLREKFETNCREIREKYLYAVLPSGQDAFAVQLSELRLVGISGFSFFPEGHLPPDCGVKIKVIKEVDAECTYEGVLRNFVLEVPTAVFENYRNIDVGYLQELMSMVIVDALHFISVMNETERETGGNGNTPPKPTLKRYRRTQRAMLRPLPAGWKASDRARILASEKQGWTIPEGRTYVSEFEINREYPERPADVPILTYTDSFFQHF